MQSDDRVLDDLLHWIWSWRVQVRRLVESTAAEGRGTDDLAHRRSFSATSYDEHILLVAGAQLVKALGIARDRFPACGDLGETGAALTLLRNLYEHWDEQRESFADPSASKVRSGKTFVERFPQGRPWSIAYGADDWVLGGAVSIKSVMLALDRLEAVALGLEQRKPENGGA